MTTSIFLVPESRDSDRKFKMDSKVKMYPNSKRNKSLKCSRKKDPNELILI